MDVLKKLVCILLTVSCYATAAETEMALIGSTPGDESIKSMLSISADAKVDFIKWRLNLTDKNTFVLDIHYGESQPNTLDFKSNGKQQTIKGTYSIAKNQKNNRFKEIYQLQGDNLSKRISLVKLNENLFHILTAQHQLMGGNGGWSYSLNREVPIDPGKILISSPVLNEKSVQLVFEGRTPCWEIANEYPKMNASSSCFKLKWKLVLNRDSVTHLPTTSVMRKVVDGQPHDVSGKWSIHKGTAANPDLIIYKIEFDKPDETISLLAGDDHVLFFLDKRNEPFIGNKDFSFALNKRTSN